MEIIINTMQRSAADGGVITVHWRTEKAAGEFVVDQYGTESFEPDPAAPGFKPYEDLEPEDVRGWLKAKWGAEGLAAKEAALDAKLADLAAPKVLSGVPWSA